MLDCCELCGSDRPAVEGGYAGGLMLRMSEEWQRNWPLLCSDCALHITVSQLFKLGLRVPKNVSEFEMTPMIQFVPIGQLPRYNQRA